MSMKLSGWFYADDCEVGSDGGLCLTFETSKHDHVFVHGLEIGYHLCQREAVELAEALLNHHNVNYTIEEGDDA